MELDPSYSKELISQLVKQVEAIENFDPQKDYESLYNNTRDYFERLIIIKKYYLDNEEMILQLGKTQLMKSFNIQPFDWSTLFSPAEAVAWETIRLSGIILYPQYPALNYFLDFANPYLKIALEVDGKEFHDPVKDRVRDQKLYDTDGWKVFRVSGTEALRSVYMPNRYPKSRDGHHRLNQYLNQSLDGVVESIKQVYFLKEQVRDEEEMEYLDRCKYSLLSHRLANFEL